MRRRLGERRAPLARTRLGGDAVEILGLRVISLGDGRVQLVRAGRVVALELVVDLGGGLELFRACRGPSPGCTRGTRATGGRCGTSPAPVRGCRRRPCRRPAPGAPARRRTRKPDPRGARPGRSAAGWAPASPACRPAGCTTASGSGLRAGTDDAVLVRSWSFPFQSVGPAACPPRMFAVGFGSCSSHEKSPRISEGSSDKYVCVNRSQGTRD